MNYRVKCTECGYICHLNQWLTADNPFQTSSVIRGCPQCRDVGCYILVCDVDGCESEVVTGWMSGDTYRWTCAECKSKLERLAQ